MTNVALPDALRLQLQGFLRTMFLQAELAPEDRAQAGRLFDAVSALAQSSQPAQSGPVRYEISTLKHRHSTYDLTEARELGFVVDLFGSMGSVYGWPTPPLPHNRPQFLLTSGNGGGRNHEFYGLEWVFPATQTQEGADRVRPWLARAVALGLIDPPSERLDNQFQIRRLLSGHRLLTFEEKRCPSCGTWRSQNIEKDGTLSLWCRECKVTTPVAALLAAAGAEGPA